MADTRKGELTSVDCGQETKILVEYEMIVYELKMRGLPKEEWKQLIYDRGSTDLKFFLVRNIKLEDGWMKIEKS